MGTKRSRKRQHIFLSIACLILFMLSACAPFKQLFAPEECSRLKDVESYISRGDFEGALKAGQDILARSPKSPVGDAALLDLGLISVHYANPKRDYKKALGYFMRLEREYPKSPLVEEAKIWIGVLQAFEKAKQVDLEIEQKKKGLGK